MDTNQYRHVYSNCSLHGRRRFQQSASHVHPGNVHRKYGLGADRIHRLSTAPLLKFVNHIVVAAPRQMRSLARANPGGTAVMIPLALYWKDNSTN
eukprot:3722318-Amphidinium_carterae.1